MTEMLRLVAAGTALDCINEVRIARAQHAVAGFTHAELDTQHQH